MRGVFQLANAAGAIVALECLSDRLPLQRSAVRAGLLAARVSGRFDVRPGSPTWVLDVAHNPQAAEVLDRALGDLFISGDRIAVCGMLEDKDSAQVASVLRRRFDRWFTIDLSAQPRGLTAPELAERIGPALPGVAVVAAGNAADLFEELSATCGDNDLVVVFGSFLTVAAASTWLAADDVPASRV
jgi:dihydrofolate synthase/folylpolyglutamate synthase